MGQKITKQLSFFVGKLCDSHNSALASCFPVSNDLVVTCYHAIKGDDTFFIVWKTASNIIVRQAKSIEDYLSENADIAFLQLSEPLPKSFFIFQLGFHWTEGGSFQTYGFRKANYYDGLSASGILRTETQKINTYTKLIQLDCRDIDKGMSGAPVLDTTYNTVVGMVCEYWDTQSSTDSSLAFAVPTSELINVNASIKSAVPELNAAPKYTESGKFKRTLSSTEFLDVEDQYIFACSRMAVIVAADQFEDGSWGRSLWKETGIKYTTDVADKHTVQTTHVKKALSATSWGAQALAKALNSSAIPSVRKAVEFVFAHQDHESAAFGNIYTTTSAFPLVNNRRFIRSPRHTASGIKLLELANGLNLDTVRGFEFLIKNQCDDGGWGEAIGDVPNTLSTAYVLDAIIKLNQISTLKQMLSASVRNRVKPAINRGMAWLIEQRNERNLWIYEGASKYAPLYSAYVLGFVPQLANDYYDEVVVSLNSLLALRINGGIPAAFDGKADFTTTCLCLYAMLRIDPKEYHSEINDFVQWIINNVVSDEWIENYSCLQGIFGLVSLIQLPNQKMEGLIKQLNMIFDYFYSDASHSVLPVDRWLDVDERFTLGLSNLIQEIYYEK